MKRSHICHQCGKSYTSRQALHRHKRSIHNGRKFPCPTCGRHFNRNDNLKTHMKTHDVEQRGEGVAVGCDVQALGGTVRVHTIPGDGDGKFDPMVFLNGHYQEGKNVLKKAIKESGGLKWYLAIKVKMTRRQGDTINTADPIFRGKCQMSLKLEDLDEGLKESLKKIYTSFIEYQRQGSNWTVDKVLELIIHMAKYRPLRAASYIPLPIKVGSKHAIINVKNNDRKCFMWSILSALHPTKRDPQRVAKYKSFTNELDFTGINFPVKLVDIPKFESLNKISINVFGYEKGHVFPIHITKHHLEKHVDLLMISKGKTTHYCWIKDLNRFLFDQKTDGHRHFFCRYCLHGFTKEKLLNDHLPYCQTHGPQKIELPKEENKWLHYKDIRKQLKVPYVIYADFESLQVPISKPKGHIASSTEKLTKHVACGFSYKVVGLNLGQCKQPVVYRGRDAAEKFVEAMVVEQKEIEKKFKEMKPLKMTRQDWRNFKKATHCHICSKPLNKDRAKDHCHVTGEFRGAAHYVCNINFKFTGRIPVVLHNLKNYDSHIIMQAIGKVKDMEIRCIPNNMEKYISFSLGCMDFIDSFQFMPSSLEKLVTNLAKEGSSKFHHMGQKFDPNKLPLLLRKQVYPYEYFDSVERFMETTLPPIEAFYSTLSGNHICIEDYNHAQTIWKTFKVQDLGHYHDLYVLTDMLALADVFENFRNICLEVYELDPAHFYTCPGLAWQAALKMTDVKLELLTDIDMHLFIEQGLRGGISMISHRHAKANHPRVPEYDPAMTNKHIMYLDANNLYGWAMSQALPVSGFDWMKDLPTITEVSQTPDDATEGYILEVDLDYPSGLHDDHNEYPLAPEKLKITEEMLSPYASQLLEELNLKGTNTEKLVPNLQSKQKYVVHYRNLKLYLSLGMKIIKVHRVLKFTQTPWLKVYIDFNTEKRKVAKNDFEKDFFKLMNNSVFGKTMENLRKRMDVKLVQDQKKAQKLIAKPSFHAFKIINKDLVAIHMLKQRLFLNRPIYAGFSVLDISKILMYDFHYTYIKSTYGPRAQLLFTDTDSLCYCIETEDIYDDMSKSKHLFDTSDYPKSHPLHSEDNKKVVGKMKDESHGISIQEFIGLKSKMYSFIYEDNGVLTEKKTAKGIKKTVIERDTRHQHYKQCLFEKSCHRSQMTQIRSYRHELFNIQLNKIGLSPFDDKRYLLDDGITSYAYGHWRIREREEETEDIEEASEEET